MAPAEIEIKVKIQPIPELAACMFTRMASDEQAETLKLIWEKMRDDYGGEYKAAMQCAYIRDDITPEAYDLLEHLTAVDEPEGFVLPVHREPSLAELLHAQRYINARLAEHGADVPKTYTVEKTHDDGTTSTACGLTADEVLECYHGGDGGDQLFHARTQRLAQAFPATPEGGYVSRIEGGTFAPAPDGFVKSAIEKAMSPRPLADNFAVAIDEARVALGIKKGGPFDDALTAFLNSGVTSIEVLYDYVTPDGPLGALGETRMNIRERNARVRVEFIDDGTIRGPGQPFEFNGVRLGDVEDVTTHVGNYTTTTVMMRPEVFIDDAGSHFDPLQARSCCPTFVNEEHADSCQSKPPVVNVVNVASPDEIAEILSDGKADAAILDAIDRNRHQVGKVLTDPVDIAKDLISNPDYGLGISVDDGKAREQWQNADAGTRVPPAESGSTSAKAPTCDECKGTGYWTNPAGGRDARSPCSKGCRP